MPGFVSMLSREARRSMAAVENKTCTCGYLEGTMFSDT